MRAEEVYERLRESEEMRKTLYSKFEKQVCVLCIENKRLRKSDCLNNFYFNHDNIDKVSFCKIRSSFSFCLEIRNSFVRANMFRKLESDILYYCFSCLWVTGMNRLLRTTHMVLFFLTFLHASISRNSFNLIYVLINSRKHRVV